MRSYDAKTPKRVKLVDAYVAFCVAVAATLMVFLALVGSFPFNSFLSAMFAALGAGSLALSLRMNLTMPKEFGGRSPESALSEFVVGNLVLFLAVWNYMG